MFSNFFTSLSKATEDFTKVATAVLKEVQEKEKRPISRIQQTNTSFKEVSSLDQKNDHLNITHFKPQATSTPQAPRGKSRLKRHSSEATFHFTEHVSSPKSAKTISIASTRPIGRGLPKQKNIDGTREMRESKSATELRNSGQFDRKESTITPRPKYFKQRKPFGDKEQFEVMDWYGTLSDEDREACKERLDMMHPSSGRYDPMRINEKSNLKILQKIMLEKKIGGKKYSAALEAAMREECEDHEGLGEKIDDDLMRNHMGNGVKFYNYILVDSTLLPKDKNIRQITFAEYIQAIFYIGKGTSDRGIVHLIDAQTLRGERKRAILENPFQKSIPKLDYIDNIWESGGGVYVHELGTHVCEHLSYIRELGMIQAFKLENLMNERSGHLFQLPTDYDEVAMVKHGVFLLKCAYQIFMNNRSPAVIPDSLNIDYVRGLDAEGKRRI